MRFTEIMRLTRTINAYNLMMNRNDFVKEFVECLRNNSNVQSYEEIRRYSKWDVLIRFLVLIYSFESMTFSYPVVSQMGVKALHDDLMTVVTQKSGDIVFPDYFLLSIDFLNGLEYLIGKYELLQFSTFSELEKTEMKELLCDIAFIVYFMIPYVCLCKSCPEQEQKRLFKELDKGNSEVEEM